MLYGSNAKKNLIKNTSNRLFGSVFLKTTREEFFLATHISIFWNSEFRIILERYQMIHL